MVVAFEVDIDRNPVNDEESDDGPVERKNNAYIDGENSHQGCWEDEQGCKKYEKSLIQMGFIEKGDSLFTGEEKENWQNWKILE